VTWPATADARRAAVRTTPGPSDRLCVFRRLGWNGLQAPDAPSPVASDVIRIPSLRCAHIETLRLAVYERFRRGGARVDDLAAELSTSQQRVSAGLADLAPGRHVILGPDGEITMAHPFTAVLMGFSVMGRDALWGAGARGTRSQCRTCCRIKDPCW
jgi:hypothetical protein